VIGYLRWGQPPNGAADKLRAAASVGFVRWMGGRRRSPLAGVTVFLLEPFAEHSERSEWAWRWCKQVIHPQAEDRQAKPTR